MLYVTRPEMELSGRARKPKNDKKSYGILEPGSTANPTEKRKICSESKVPPEEKKKHRETKKKVENITPEQYPTLS